MKKTIIPDSPDDQLILFQKLIQKIFNDVRHKGMPSYESLPEFVTLFEILCPTLAVRFRREPSSIYASAVIDFALKGLGNQLLKNLWEDNDVIGYAPDTIKKHSQSFGSRVAKHLWIKNSELEGINRLPNANPLTVDEFLKQQFRLSPGEIEVLKAFGKSDNQGRKEIAASLFISLNTLKTHVKSIMRKMKTKTINEAVAIMKSFVP